MVSRKWSFPTALVQHIQGRLWAVAQEEILQFGPSAPDAAVKPCGNLGGMLAPPNSYL